MAISKDLLLSIDDFNSPTVVNDADAWSHMILDLLFIEPGTYAESPELGININEKRYMEVGALTRYISNELKNQAEAYLSTIPLRDITVSSQIKDNGDVILIITISFVLSRKIITRSAFVSLEDELVNLIVDTFDSN